MSRRTQHITSRILPYRAHAVGLIPFWRVQPAGGGQEPGDPIDPGDPGTPDPAYELEIVSHDVLLDPIGDHIADVVVYINQEVDFVIDIYHDSINSPVFRLLNDQGDVAFDWQETPQFILPFSVNGSLFTVQMKNNWDEISSVDINVTTDLEETFEFTGEPEEIEIMINGWYELECFGAQGGGNPSVANHGGRGGRAKGKIYLNAGDTLYFYVGGQGVYGEDMNGETAPGGWNGGGDGGSSTGIGNSGSSGGGATDIRLNGTDLENRIIVAGAGAGGNGNGSINRRIDGSSGGGGGYYGGGGGGNRSGNNVLGQGGTQTAGGSGWTNGDGQLGVGGNGEQFKTTSTSGSSEVAPGGDGGGEFGGNGFYSVRGSTGGGGSSFISMLEDGETESGVHEGDGLAKIESLGLADIEFINIEITKDTEIALTFDLIGALGATGQTRIIYDGSPYNGQDWGTDTGFTFPLAMEFEDITIEAKDMREQVVFKTITILRTFESEFSATDDGRLGTIQSFEVPYTGTYRISAVGAQGGNTPSNSGGKGALVEGDFFLTEGDALNMLVGQQGIGGSNSQTNHWSAGGGGGTFIEKEFMANILDDVSSGLPNSSYGTSGSNAENAWDNSQGTFAGHSFSTGAWFSVDLGEQVEVKKISNWFRDGASTPKDWRIQGSNDESAWDDLLVVEDGPRDDITHTYDLTTTGSYRYYRIFVDINHGGISTRIYSMVLYKELNELQLQKEIILVAGGGGGAYHYSNQNHDGFNALITQNGGVGGGGISGGTNGGAGNESNGARSAGALEDGTRDAKAYINGGDGGLMNSAWGYFGLYGGFGGGAGAGLVSGGGGGYSGGGSGTWPSFGHGGGGGSLNSGMSQNNEAGAGEGHGKVEIELIAIA